MNLNGFKVQIVLGILLDNIPEMIIILKTNNLYKMMLVLVPRGNEHSQCLSGDIIGMKLYEKVIQSSSAVYFFY